MVPVAGQANVKVLVVGVVATVQLELSRPVLPVAPTMYMPLPTRRPCAKVVVTVAVVPLTTMALVAAGIAEPVKKSAINR